MKQGLNKRGPCQSGTLSHRSLTGSPYTSERSSESAPETRQEEQKSQPASNAETTEGEERCQPASKAGADTSTEEEPFARRTKGERRPSSSDDPFDLGADDGSPDALPTIRRQVNFNEGPLGIRMEVNGSRVSVKSVNGQAEKLGVEESWTLRTLTCNGKTTAITPSNYWALLRDRGTTSCMIDFSALEASQLGQHQQFTFGPGKIGIVTKHEKDGRLVIAGVSGQGKQVGVQVGWELLSMTLNEQEHEITPENYRDILKRRLNRTSVLTFNTLPKGCTIVMDGTNTADKTLKFSTAKLGITPQVVQGVVTIAKVSGQAQLLGVKVGWILKSLQVGKKVEELHRSNYLDVLHARHNKSCKITFTIPVQETVK